MGAIKRYTKEEEDYIRNNYDKVPLQEIAQNINRNCISIYDKMRDLGISIYSSYDYIIQYENIKMIENEEFRNIHNVENYMVSNKGRIARTRNVEGKIVVQRILKNTINCYGYETIRITVNSKTMTLSIHRLVAEAFIPNPNNLKEVNHKDSNKLNNCVENLEWCTRKYNLNQPDCKKSQYKKRNKIIRVDKVSGEILEYDSIATASEELKIEKAFLNKACRGKVLKNKSKESHYCRGYFWYYKTPDTVKHKKAVIQYNGIQIVNRFESSAEASRKTGIGVYGIRQCCNGNLKTAGGYIWRYEDETV